MHVRTKTHKLNEKQEFSLKRNQTFKGLYLNRAVGCYRHYCVITGDIDAGPATGKKAGTVIGMQGEHAFMGADMEYVLPG